MISTLDIENAFSFSAVKSRVDLDDALMNAHGELESAVYEILVGLRSAESRWGAILRRSDGGVQEFDLVYRVGSYDLIVMTIAMPWPRRFKGASDFAGWLNMLEMSLPAGVVWSMAR